MNAVVNFQKFVQIHNNQTVTTSEFIAQAFKKQHKDVLRNIDNLLADIAPDFATQNFKEVEVNRPSPLTGSPIKSRAYELTKDGFMLLVMGFTGKAALAIKIAYIQAFNQMAQMLSGSLKPDFHLTAQTTPDERKPLRDAVFALAKLNTVLPTPPLIKWCTSALMWKPLKSCPPSKSRLPWNMCTASRSTAKCWTGSLKKPKSHLAKVSCANWQR